MYKVVRVQSVDPDVLVSSVVLGQAKVTYIPGEWTYPPDFICKRHNGIFVFEQLYQAKDYMDYLICFGESYEIWGCEIQQSEYPIKMYDLDWLRNGLVVPNEWAIIPNGTVMATKIKLVEKIA